MDATPHGGAESIELNSSSWSWWWWSCAAVNGIECQQGETNAADTQHFTAAAASRVESSRIELRRK